MTALDTLVVATSLTTIRLDLGASIEQLEWTVNAYNLSFAVLLMTAAALGDRLGRRRMFAAGVALFTLASAACALAPGAGSLIAARAVQGAGAALVMTLAMALVSSAYPPERRGSALGVFFALTGLAVASGPLVGGAVAEGLAWQWIFWLNVPLGLVVVPLALARIPESFGPDRRLDLPGLALVSGGVLGLVWALVRGNVAGWASAEVLGTAVAGAALLAAFVRWELRAPAPMLPMRFFRSRAFSAGNAAIFFAIGSLFTGVFFLAQFMQTGLGSSPLEAGLRLLPWTATLFFTAPVAGKLADRFGERAFMVAGPLLQGVGMGWIALAAGPGVAYARARRAADRRGRRRLDVVPGRAELRRLRGAAGGDRQGERRQQHDARAGRRVRDRAQRGGVRRRGQLRLAGRVHRRLQRRDGRLGRALAARLAHGRRAPAAPARGRPRRAGLRGRVLRRRHQVRRPPSVWSKSPCTK